MEVVVEAAGCSEKVGPIKEGFIVGFYLLKTSIDMGSRIKANEGSSLEGLDLNKLLNNHTEFNKLLDDDAVRVCLLLALDFVFMGFKLRHVIANELLGLVDDLSAWNDFPWEVHREVDVRTNVHHDVDEGLSVPELLKKISDMQRDF
nr:phospholipase-like protein [Tanacetum cinerariifolium]